MSSNEYMRQYMANRYYRRKQEAISLLGGKCARCGSTKGLQFDHKTRGDKSFSICKFLAGISDSRFREELKKCQLLCQECHSKKTCGELGRNYVKGTHGTISAYVYCGPPKCVACKKAKRDWFRQWRAKNRAEVTS